MRELSINAKHVMHAIVLVMKDRKRDGFKEHIVQGSCEWKRIANYGRIAGYWTEAQFGDVRSMLFNLAKAGYLVYTKEEQHSGWNGGSWMSYCFTLTEKGKDKCRELFASKKKECSIEICANCNSKQPRFEMYHEEDFSLCEDCYNNSPLA